MFTPSTQPTLDQIAEPPGGEQAALNDLQSSLGQPLTQSLQINQQSSVQLSQSPVPPMVGTLTPAQTQYFSQVKLIRVSLPVTYFYVYSCSRTMIL